MKISLALVTVFVLVASNFANANVITQTVNITQIDDRSTSVEYVNFSVLTAGTFDISACGLPGGCGTNEDPMIILFENVLASGNDIATNDDGGIGFDSLISGFALSVGNYILAVSDFFIDPSEAINGVNLLTTPQAGTIFIEISSANGVARLNNVPEPSTIAILALGVIGLGARRFKK